jgi:hypothetical protein
MLGIECCTAVGSYEKSHVREVLAERWNGTSWQTQETPSPTGKEGTQGELTQVSCASATSCVAIGAYNSSPTLLLGEHWNGKSWELDFPTNRTGVEDNILSGVSCPSETICASVGYSQKTATDKETLAERLELP